VFNGNKHLVTFLLIHLLTNSVARLPAAYVVEMSQLLCKHETNNGFSVMKINVFGGMLSLTQPNPVMKICF